MFRRGWLLILCLLASSLIATGPVCASDAGAAAAISCGGISDAHDDAVQSPGDDDQGTLHHHAACHGHNITVAFAVPTLSPILLTRAAPSPAQPVRLARRTIDPALKPPKA